ncbi:non-ribosomal peptide synthetase [Streptomyces corynorhini]|uniref:Amino acid adenylation domain-containing protein n=1 Tax=Streptomyces corynorhini TaxID=2282652 RepID=A0A370B9H1_9ACTN|nr:amino acid adenylation domain-containing protein [Streptomyces corynorhini]RDG36794.1 amino acid adenylation domain-containing protein [Streptomyces corynorhini]
MNADTSAAGAVATWPAVLVPADRPRRAGALPRAAGLVRGTLPGAAREGGASAHALLTACFAALLHRLTGQDLIALATPEGITGYAVDADSTAADLAARGTPVTPGADLGTPLVAVAHGTERRGAPPFELHLALDRRDDGWTAELSYDERLFTADSARRVLARLRTLTASAVRAPLTPVSRLALLTAEETHRVLTEWNDTAADLPHGTCLHTAFEERAAADPGAPAVVHGARTWTYGEVDACANRLAHRLREAGVGPDVRVGLCLERSATLLASVLGILKAGGAYVPLDPDYPAQRLTAMLDGTSCAAVVTDRIRAAALPTAPPGTERQVVLVEALLDGTDPDLAARPDTTPGPSAGPDDLCYVIHTSGSTGLPKPIALRHRGVVNNLADLNSRFGVGSSDTILGLSSPSFDMSVYEFLGITAAGGTVVVPEADRAKDVAHWAHLFARHEVTVWNSAPALLELLTEHLERTGGTALARLRLVMLGGDWCPVSLPDRVRALAPDVRFVVLGGATEASIHSTVYEVVESDAAWTSIPYGRPMANQRAYVLDDALQPVPPGVVGELHLAGTGLARGYLERPALTAERFLEWSYGDVRDRLYRTGDLARWRADGVLELLGRKDFQVKLHGLRVELGEIEAVLRAHPEVKDAVVTAREDGSGARRLVGHAVPCLGAAPRPGELRAHLAKVLPSFMVPAAVLVLDELPLNVNGKLDRKALGALSSAPDAAERDTSAVEAPVGAWEEHIAAVWQDVLRAGPVGRDADFFSLGGDSMSALRCLARIDDSLRWPELFSHPTVRRLAAHLAAAGRTPPRP